MSGRWRWSWALALLVAVCAALTPALAAGKLVVKIGESADSAAVTLNHNVTPDLLKRAKAAGGGDFWAKDAQVLSFGFRLDAKQIGDLMNGATVVVDSKKDETGKAKPMRITLEMKEQTVVANPPGY